MTQSPVPPPAGEGPPPAAPSAPAPPGAAPPAAAPAGTAPPGTTPPGTPPPAGAKPAPPPKPEAPPRTPEEMLSPELRAFLEEKLRSGHQVTIEVGKARFTGRIFRLMLHEGWIALEHVDGRRNAFFVYQGGTIGPAEGGERISMGGSGHPG